MMISTSLVYCLFHVCIKYPHCSINWYIVVTMYYDNFIGFTKFVAYLSQFIKRDAVTYLLNVLTPMCAKITYEVNQMMLS